MVVETHRIANRPDGYPKNNPEFNHLAKKVVEEVKENKND